MQIKDSYDLIVIGSGPAGEKAAVKAAYFGKKVALIEKSPDAGGAGVQTGTLPSKALKETALYFSRVYEKQIYEQFSHHSRKTKHEQFTYRRDIARTDMQKEVENNLLRHKVDVYRGFASFVDEHLVHIKGDEDLIIEGKNILRKRWITNCFTKRSNPFNRRRKTIADSEFRKLPKITC